MVTNANQTLRAADVHRPSNNPAVSGFLMGNLLPAMTLGLAAQPFKQPGTARVSARPLTTSTAIQTPSTAVQTTRHSQGFSTATDNQHSHSDTQYSRSNNPAQPGFQHSHRQPAQPFRHPSQPVKQPGIARVSAERHITRLNSCPETPPRIPPFPCIK